MARVINVAKFQRHAKKKKLYLKFLLKKNVNYIIYNYPAIVSTRLKKQIFLLVKLFFYLTINFKYLKSPIF